MKQKIIKAICGSPDRPLKIGDIEIPCYVLEDGRRVITQSGALNVINISRGGSGSRGGDRLVKFVSGKIIKGYISNNLIDRTESPIKFKTPSRITAYGYEATILPDICDAVLEARKNRKLQKQQEHIAKRCEILVRGFARIGIIALVDEATGYQEIRDKDELHKILEAYIVKELLPWTERFPKEFYKQLFRLREWQYSPLSVKRPQYVGKLTNQLIYEKLPNGVLEELRGKNPKNIKGHRRYRHHQFLTEDIGNPHLEKQVASITTLMRASINWNTFKRLFERAFPTPGPKQLKLFTEREEEDI